MRRRKRFFFIQLSVKYQPSRSVLKKSDIMGELDGELNMKLPLMYY